MIKLTIHIGNCIQLEETINGKFSSTGDVPAGAIDYARTVAKSGAFDKHQGILYPPHVIEKIHITEIK